MKAHNLPFAQEVKGLQKLLIPGGINKGKNRKKFLTKRKSRRDERKERRQNKKLTKHQYILSRFGKTLEPKTDPKKKAKKRTKKKKKKGNKETGDNKNQESSMAISAEDGSDNDEFKNPPNKASKNTKIENKRRKVSDEDSFEDQDLKKLKKEMEETRRKRLLEENKEEDKIISKYEKKLKLKKNSIPSSFKSDGLDYLLELCSSSNKKSKVLGTSELPEPNTDEPDGSISNSEMSDADSGDMNSEEESIGNCRQDQDESDDQECSENDSDFDDGDFEEESDNNERSLEDENPDESLEESELESEIGDDVVGDTDSSEAKSKSSQDFQYDKKDKITMKTDECLKPGKRVVKGDKKGKSDVGLWEDIYGRLRKKDGSIVDVNSDDLPDTGGKYVPPMQRGNDRMSDLSRSLKGLINRISEANIHTISKQIENMYMQSSRNEVNECLLSLFKAALCRTTFVPDRVILEHVMLIAILHGNIGSEIGAFFVQSFVELFNQQYQNLDLMEPENKTLENTVNIIGAIYQFKMIDASLVYDILNMLAHSFKAKDIEIMLTALRNIGFRLRKDDPGSLKEYILLIQEKAVEMKPDCSSAKVKFMLDIVTAIKNNNMTKIPNYDPHLSIHLTKVMKICLRKGNYISTLKIGLRDLLNAKTKGRWWMVGSAWNNTTNESESGEKVPVLDTSELSTESKPIEESFNKKLLVKARKLGMNTETRKRIFCILVSAEDYMDAFEKLSRLDLKNAQEREIINVAVHCCLSEKKFNPFYILVCSKFCGMDRKYKLTLQYGLWDRLKSLEDVKPSHMPNLEKMVANFINDKILPLSILKVVDYAEMDKTKLLFLMNVLREVLLQPDESNLQHIFIKPSMSDNLSFFRESLGLFMSHFMVQESIVLKDGETVILNNDPLILEKLKSRINLAKTALSSYKHQM